MKVTDSVTTAKTSGAASNIGAVYPGSCSHEMRGLTLCLLPATVPQAHLGSARVNSWPHAYVALVARVNSPNRTNNHLLEESRHIENPATRLWFNIYVLSCHFCPYVHIMRSDVCTSHRSACQSDALGVTKRMLMAYILSQPLLEVRPR